MSKELTPGERINRLPKWAQEHFAGIAAQQKKDRQTIDNLAVKARKYDRICDVIDGVSPSDWLYQSIYQTELNQIRDIVRE